MLYIHQASNINGFYFVASKEYDTNLDIQNSLRSDFSIAIPREVEPGIIKIFDFDLQYIRDHMELRVLSLTDDDFVYDTVTYSIQE